MFQDYKQLFCMFFISILTHTIIYIYIYILEGETEDFINLSVGVTPRPLATSVQFMSV
jgi:hypothetical protein